MPVVVVNNRAIVFSPISGCTEELAHWPKRYAAVVVVFVEERFILAPSIICVSHIGNKTTAESHANIKCYREKRNSFILLICLHKYTLVTRMLWLILCRRFSCSWGFPVVSAMDWTYSLLHSFLAVAVLFLKTSVLLCVVWECHCRRDLCHFGTMFMWVVTYRQESVLKLFASTALSITHPSSVILMVQQFVLNRKTPQIPLSQFL